MSSLSFRALFILLSYENFLSLLHQGMPYTFFIQWLRYTCRSNWESCYYFINLLLSFTIYLLFRFTVTKQWTWATTNATCIWDLSSLSLPITRIKSAPRPSSSQQYRRMTQAWTGKTKDKTNKHKKKPQKNLMSVNEMCGR